MLNRGILVAIYVLSALLGVMTLAFPAPSVEGAIGLVLTYAYGALILLGSIGAFVGVALPNYRTEMYWLWPLAGGYAAYAIALWSLFFERIGVVDGLPPPYGPAMAVTILSTFLLAKSLFLMKKNKELIRAVGNGNMG